MRHLSKAESRERWTEICELLWRWDPVGVSSDPDWPRDEYDCLAGPVLRLLESGAPQTEIADYLRHEIELHFGLDPKHYDFAAFASLLDAWFRDRWAGSIV